MCGFSTPAPRCPAVCDTSWWPTAPLSPDTGCPEVAQAPRGRKGLAPRRRLPPHTPLTSPGQPTINRGFPHSPQVRSFAVTAHRTQETHLLDDRFITKGTGERPDDEACGMRSGRVPSAGASVPVELGAPLPAVGCPPSQKPQALPVGRVWRPHQVGAADGSPWLLVRSPPQRLPSPGLVGGQLEGPTR